VWGLVAIFLIANASKNSDLQSELSTARADASNALNKASAAEEKAEALEARLDAICDTTNGNLGCE
jgi:hypothetical protein